MKRIVLLLSVIFFASGFAYQVSDTPFKIVFRLLNKKIKTYKKYDEKDLNFLGEIHFTNLTDSSFSMPSRLHVGWKGEFDPFYLEAYKLNGKEEDITFKANGGDYIMAIDPEINFEKGSTCTDTFDIRQLFRFRHAGVYKIRVVCVPEYFFHSNNISMRGIVIYSNWDTVYVKD